MKTTEIKKAIEDLDLDCHPDYVGQGFVSTFKRVLEAGMKFKAHSASSSGIGRYWEVECDELPGSALLYADSDHDNPGEDAKSDCKKLNSLLSVLSSEKSK